MALRLMTLEKVIDTDLLRFFFTGGVRTDYKAKFPEVQSTRDDPAEKAKEETEVSNWFTKVCWTKIEELDETIPIMKGYRDKFKSKILDQNNLYENSKLPISETFPHLTDNFDPKTSEYINKNKNNFLKLILIRISRPEFVIRSTKYMLEE